MFWSPRAWLFRRGTLALLLVKIKHGSFSWRVLLGIVDRVAVDATWALGLVPDA